MCAILISKLLRLACINEGSQCHLPPMHTFIHIMSHTCLYPPDTQIQSITALWPVLTSRPT